MKFAQARPCKWCITYTIDSDPDQKESHLIFNKYRDLLSWMDRNEDKSIIRMSIFYNY